MRETNPQSITAYIGLGSNLGDSADLINKALKKLDNTDGIVVIAVSSTIETKPLGGKKQPDYLNTVAGIKTELCPGRLHEQMKLIEDSLGRVRGEKWAPRTIDLDLLLYGNEVIDRPALTVPHSQMHLRSFVLRGVCELDANLQHPILKRSMKVLASRIGGHDFVLDPVRPQLISVAGIIGVGKTTLAEGLAERLGCRLLREAYDTNPFIADEYAGKKDVALDCEMYFLNTRAEQLDKSTLSPGQVVVSDYIFDKSMLYARWMLDTGQLNIYSKRYTEKVEAIATPVLVIYMKDSSQRCLERIHERNRPYEQQIELKMLEKFYDDYENLFAGWNESPVIRISVDQFNCLNADDMNMLANEIKSYIWKLQKQ